MGLRLNVVVLGTMTAIASAANGTDPRLADYFGFSPLEVVKIDQNAGPLQVADVNGDGLLDLIAVNNFKSRIEVHYQKADAKPDDELTGTLDVNELPEHWRFRKQLISVSHRVSAVAAHDFDGDGRMDLIYTGSPPEIVFVRQSQPGVFDVARRTSVKGLSANRNGLAVTDLIGDNRPELAVLVNGQIWIYPLNNTTLGQPVKLMAGSNMLAFFVEDFNGDGRQDVIGVVPDDSAPVRLWLGGLDGSQGVLGAQLRFEMPALRDLKPLRFPNEPAARIAVIEAASRRMVMYNVESERIAATGDRDASMRVYSFTDPANRKRSVSVVDVDGDGLLDLLATDTQSNAVVMYRQMAGKGMQPGQNFPSYSELLYLAAGNVDSDPSAEVFVLSEKEGVVGRSNVTNGRLSYPQAMTLSAGSTPVVLALVQLEHGPHLAVVGKDARNYVLDLIDMEGKLETIKLGALSRSPETVVALDADQDGKTDLLLFTPDKPMTMLTAAEKGFKLLESKDMGQFGLVQAASSTNTEEFDVDGDGKPELLIADRNYVRAVRYQPAGQEGVSPGWQVVAQINADDPTAKLVSVAVLGDRIVAADRENRQLLVMGRDSSSGGAWKQLESLNVRGFNFTSIYAGSFAGDGQENILAIGDDGFAVIRLGGDRTKLTEFAAFRNDKQRRMEHEMAVGDVNSDGFVDIVALDAGEQMCELFTFSEAKRLLVASEFKIFESKIFSGGEAREIQPSMVIIADITGDGANDLLMLTHDRVLIYPQMTETNAAR